VGPAEDKGFLWEDDVVVAKVFSVVAEGTGGDGGGGDVAPRPRSSSLYMQFTPCTYLHISFLPTTS